ncbi:MAG: iron-containing alcohol dehydrogenase [Opitutales bacterium]|nr:iron-containing alcohol dehydrogenase [Opitutales bacterium]
MHNFEFFNPTKVIFGKGTIAKLDRNVPADGKIMILYGGGSAQRNGTLDEVKKALPGRTLLEFGGIEPNPSFETLMQAVEIVRREQATFLIAVGGGSVIDGVKFVAAAAPYSGDPWGILQTYGKTVKEALPFGTVLTLPATGSEMNNGSVISRKEQHLKLFFQSKKVFPVFSILDPEKTYTLPKRQIANGIVDAFVHVMEQYLTIPVGARLQDRFAESILQTLIEVAPAAINSHDYSNRADFMWCATMALNGLIASGVPEDWATHMIGHEITALYGIDHARTLAIVMPSLLNERKDAKCKKLLQYAERVWKLTEGSDEQRMDAAVAKTREFFEELGLKTHLSDYDLGLEAVDAILANLQKSGMSKLGEDGKIDPVMCRRILEAAL